MEKNYPILDTPVGEETFKAGQDLLVHELPVKAILFFGDLDRYAEKQHFKILDYLSTITTRYNLYQYKDVVLIKAPLGGPAAAQNMEYLYSCGVKKIIAVGCCASLFPDVRESFYIPTEALRDEGTSYKYLAPSDFIETDKKLTEHLSSYLDSQHIKYTTCKVWSTDGLYRETANIIAKRKEQGCSIVDMECASLSACAKYRGIQYAQLFFSADQLMEDKHDLRGGFGNLDGFEITLNLALQCLINL